MIILLEQLHSYRIYINQKVTAITALYLKIRMFYILYVMHETYFH